MKVGLDIGSTTIKCVILDEKENIVYTSYERHFSKIVEKTLEVLNKIKDFVTRDKTFSLAISGSAGMKIAEKLDIPFIQEVYSTKVAVDKLNPGTDTIIELGGEDAKILFLTNGLEVRMNGTCAGGTGAFIDQMATLLHITVDELNDCAKKAERTYVIASRCGVFAKSDIQPLLNQGAKKEDISKSILDAVVNQTIVGLAQGREVEGNVLFLGGPLTFLSELRNAFNEKLNIEGKCPENSLFYVAYGASLKADNKLNYTSLVEKVKNYSSSAKYNFIEPLFKSKEEYDEFIARHEKERVEVLSLADYKNKVYLGIDAGSTTVKFVVIGEEGELLYSNYQPNSGNPIPLILEQLKKLYNENPNIKIAKSAVTGYGEDLIKNAFKVDIGVVETVAHFTAAKKFMPNVDFIIDIGGQDIKCFKIRNGAIDNIFLNEACSSGCGSFLQTFANVLGYDIKDFAELGLFADKPADLGSRCTVFMNSSVKQAQKDGASVENISAGLSISVVKNALYKVIRVTNPEELGKNIVVQGGTFYNNAVLRAFEKEMKTNVIRPNIAGIMGAYGAALYARSKDKDNTSTIISKEEVEEFSVTSKTVNCGMCSNNCCLTVNTFKDGRKFISGNKCERPIKNQVKTDRLDLYEYKQELLKEYKPQAGSRGKIGIPMVLNMYDLLPFWHTFFTNLGFEVVVSPYSTRDIYISGQTTIPSDTICFPAKLVHGHIKYLINEGIDKIFYPCMTYNLDEGLGDNHYNCPVVAYYPEVIEGNMKDVKDILFIYDYVGIHKKRHFMYKVTKILNKYFMDISIREVKNATKAAFAEYANYRSKVEQKGEEIIKKARENGMQIVVLAGRPYHVDPEINHGIDRLITTFNVAVITEDSLSPHLERVRTDVLNQWTFHARLYAAAKYITTQPDMDLVQLVSFGCGVDAITTDEVRSILERANKVYTQIKIDEITNLGAVKIRLRSLLAAIEEKKESK